MLDLQRIRQDFPILQRKTHNQPLVYLDNAATSQKPRQVIEAVKTYYENHNANVHRGVHTLSDEATQMVEDVREKVRKLIGARYKEEIIFTKNATEAINLVAQAWGKENLADGDAILLTEMEHHANIIPWLQLKNQNPEVGIEYVGVTQNGLFNQEDLSYKLQITKYKLLALTHVSNVLGTINPVADIIKKVKKTNPETRVLVDAAQSVPHMQVDVQKLNCDFLVFSAHKMLGPTGVGVLYAKKEILQQMPPFLGGGGMIKKVFFDYFEPADLPDKFEAGTLNIAGIAGLGAAIDYLESVGLDAIHQHEQELTQYTLGRLLDKQSRVGEWVKILGPTQAPQRTGLISFYFDHLAAHDVAAVLDSEGIAVRSGHHCAQPLHRKLGIPASLRASFYLYNTQEEVDKLIQALQKAVEVLG